MVTFFSTCNLRAGYHWARYSLKVPFPYSLATGRLSLSRLRGRAVQRTSQGLKQVRGRFVLRQFFRIQIYRTRLGGGPRLFPTVRSKPVFSWQFSVLSSLLKISFVALEARLF